jgi:PAS domain S-box-containing protein
MYDYLKSLIQYAGDAIFTVGKSQCILSWNLGAQELLGYSPEEIIGKAVDVLSPADNKRFMRATVMEVMEGEALKNLECEMIGKNGKVAVYLTASPIKDEVSEVVGVSVIAKDVTDQNILLQKFIEQQRRDAHVRGLIESLTTINHHIRNAIAGSGLKADVCRRINKLEEYQDLCTTCARQTKRITAVLESLHQLVTHARAAEEDANTVNVNGSPSPQFDIEADLEARLKKIDESESG